MVCKKCGYQNSSDAVFCSGCGIKLADMEKKICKKCGAENSPSARFCSRCGADLNSTGTGISPRTIMTIGVAMLIVVIGIVAGIKKFGTEKPAGEVQVQTTDAGQIEAETTAQNSNKLMEDTVPIVEDYYDPNETYQVFGLSTVREDVCSITFYNSLDKAPSGKTTDVSLNKDGSVVAWLEPDAASELYRLNIAAEGNIVAPKNCEGLFSNYTNLQEIDFNHCFDTSLVENMANMFGSCHELTELDLRGFNTSNVTDMRNMFASMFCMEELDLSSFDTSNVEDMSAMFSSCDQLRKADLTSFDTGRVCDMSDMFVMCTMLETLDLSNFDVSNVLYMHNMFARCRNLKELNLSNFDTSNVLNMAGMFEECESLKYLDLSNFNTARVENMSMMFRRCYNLKYLDISNFDYSGISNDGYLVMMFDACDSLSEEMKKTDR